MATVLTLIGKRPGQQQFGLDTFTESYKCDATADVVLTDATVPQMGSAHPDYEFMFVIARPCTETGESASVLDLIYMGCLTDDGEGNPILPAQQNQAGNSVMSASSSRSFSGVVLSSPMTAQYYGPTNQLSYVSYAGAGTVTANDPSSDVQLITLTLGDTTVSITSTTEALIDDFFSPLITSVIQSTEIVSTKFWNNTAVATKTLSPYIFTFPSGPFLILAAPGTGYAIGNTLTIAGGGGTAVIDLTQVGIAGSITGWTITSITCTTPQNNVAASGGSGSGARFNIVIIA